jgi:hypothetical protein
MGIWEGENWVKCEVSVLALLTSQLSKDNDSLPPLPARSSGNLPPFLIVARNTLEKLAGTYFFKDPSRV